MDLRVSGPKKNHKKGFLQAAKEKRRKDAEARQAAYNLLTFEQKLAKLDAGGHKATKQRYKLLMKSIALKTKEQ
jgi:hypothetical protein